MNLEGFFADIDNISQNKHYQAGLGKDIASTQSKSTWTDKSIDPSAFYKFLKKYKWSKIWKKDW